jgi:hypothetical protein
MGIKFYLHDIKMPPSSQNKTAFMMGSSDIATKMGERQQKVPKHKKRIPKHLH